VAATRRDLTTLLAQLRKEHVREYEEDEAGNVRVVFDASAFVVAPAAPGKSEKPRQLAAVVALKGFAPGFNPDGPAG
jgi:uncharacterized protein (DUF58 family)